MGGISLVGLCKAPTTVLGKTTKRNLYPYLQRSKYSPATYLKIQKLCISHYVASKINSKCLKGLFGDSDVGDSMMATDLRCWWQNPYVGYFFRYIGDFLNVLNRSPTS